MHKLKCHSGDACCVWICYISAMSASLVYNEAYRLHIGLLKIDDFISICKTRRFTENQYIGNYQSVHIEPLAWFSFHLEWWFVSFLLRPFNLILTSLNFDYMANIIFVNGKSCVSPISAEHFTTHSFSVFLQSPSNVPVKQTRQNARVFGLTWCTIGDVQNVSLKFFFFTFGEVGMNLFCTSGW